MEAGGGSLEELCEYRLGLLGGAEGEVDGIVCCNVLLLMVPALLCSGAVGYIKHK